MFAAAISWKREADNSLTYEATIPPTTTAELTLPKNSPWGTGDTTPEIQTLTSGSHKMIVK